MIVCELADLQLWRVAMKRLVQSLPECESRDRCRKWLEAINLEIKVMSLLKASGSK